MPDPPSRGLAPVLKTCMGRVEVENKKSSYEQEW